jgi:hypothetical protein
METTIIVREGGSVEAVLFILAKYGVDYDEKGPYLEGVVGHFNARDLADEARKELLPLPDVTLMPTDAVA